MLTRVASLVFALATVSNSVAHMILEHPIPYGNSTLNNSPLDGAGLDFPCRQREGVYDLTQMNYWTAGEAQNIRFLGSAVHGGGSCQFSVTRDLRPTSTSKWKVVHSVIGGCPASAEGNLTAGSTSQAAATFDVVLPESMPSGNHTFSWTWFNKQGNREMYMNCAPISVSGGSNDTALFESLPDMFVANLGTTACSTPENFDYAFPEPGDSVVTGSQAKIATTLAGSGCASPTALGGSAGVDHSSGDFAHSLSNRSGMKTTPYPLTAASVVTAGPRFLKDAKKDYVLEESSVMEPQVLVAQATSILAPEMAIPPSTLPATLVAASEPCIPCSTRDSIVCIGESQYGLCIDYTSLEAQSEDRCPQWIQ